MAVDKITGIDSVQDLYLKTYARLKAVSEQAAETFASQVMLNGATSAIDMGDTSSSISSVDNITDTYISTINTIKAAQRSTSGIYDSSGTFTSSVLGSSGLNSSGLNISDLDVESFLESAVLNSIDEDQKNMIERMQEAFRVNTSTIVDTMQSLGLTFNDLADRTNMLTLGNAFNNQAIEYGLPAVENVESAVDMLYNGFGEGSGSGGNGAGSGTAVEEITEEYSNIVVEGDKTYLETVTIENGVKTVVRTEMR